MPKQKLRYESDDLGAEIERLQALYDAGTPEVSDAEFDELVTKLRSIDPEHPALSHLGKPRSKNRVKHYFPMLSLNKCYSDDEMLRWANALEREVERELEFAVQPKYDGVSLSLTYDEGWLKRAVLRGDGWVGDEITYDRIRFVNDVPQRINTWRGVIHVRGEVVMDRGRFEATFAKDFANPRNCVAGALNAKSYVKQGDPINYCRFIAYDALVEQKVGEGASTSIYQDSQVSYVATMEALRVVGRFQIAETIYCGAQELTDVREELANSLRSVDAAKGPETDGVVIKLTNLEVRKHLGATDHHPRWAMAYKFQGESGETVLRHVLWQVSRRGTVTPVAVVDPVQLSGVTVTRATLHNLDQMESLGIKIGDSIVMTRRGGVIPHVEGVKEAAEKGEAIEYPTRCPSCAGPLKRVGGFLSCVKKSTCPEVRMSKIVHYAYVLDIQGLGPERVAVLFAAGKLTTVLDLYRPMPPSNSARVANSTYSKQWGPLIGETEAGKIGTQLGLKSLLSLDKFLAALGFDGLGKSLGRKLLARFGTIEDLFAANPGDLAAIEGVGLKRAQSVCTALTENRDLIEALLEYVEIEEAPSSGDVKTGPFAGKSVVFTGKLTDMDREEARAFVRKYGGETPDGVTMRTDYLVIGDLAKDEQRTKRERAEKYIAKGAPLRIITESEFAAMLAEAAEAE